MRNVDSAALLAVVLIAVLSAFPFFRNDGLPAMTDAELHILRIAEIGYSIQEGDLYPRWAPDFYYGYGYPIFNYYAPFSYHLGYYLSLGTPENAAQAAKLLFVTALLLGAFGAYTLAKHFTSQGGGLVGAAAFSFSPYIQLINPHSRGDLAEVVALGFLPWVIYSWFKLWEKPTKSNMFFSVLFTSATLLSHNLTGLTMLVILAFMALWQWFVVKKTSSTKYVLLTALIFVMLTAFFWLPFLVERNDILLDVAGDGHYDYRNHFVTLGDLFSLTKPFDYKDAAMSIPFSAGPIQVIITLFGGLYILFIRKKNHKLHLLSYLILSSWLFFLLITNWSLPIWENLPGIGYFQFPWRFLGPLAVMMAPVIAVNVQNFGAWLAIRKYSFLQPVVMTILVSIIIITALPGLYPIPWISGFGKITQLSILQAELQGRWRGTTSTNDFVPATVEMLPGPEKSVIDSYSNPPVDRVNRYTLPEGTSVQVLDDQPNHFSTNSDRSFLLRLYLFDFPGWRAYIDGIEASIEIAHPEGFITVKVPSGQHDVVLKMENTRIQSISWWISIIGLLIGVGVLIFMNTPQCNWELQITSQKGDARTVTFILGIVALISAITIVILDPGQVMHYSSGENIALPADQHLYMEFEHEIALLGYDISANKVKPGSILEIELYWIAKQNITHTYQSFVHVMTPSGQILTQSDHLNPGGFPTNLWPLDRYIRDRHRLTIPENIEPGSYIINVGLYSLESKLRLNTYDTQTGKSVNYFTLNDTVQYGR